MHKGVIILTKAEDRAEALENVESFLEPYGNGDVWDWYSVGNRWHNTLAPKDKREEFYEWMKQTYPKCFEGGYAIDYVENGTDRPIIQAKWEELGLKGHNPFFSGYGFGLPKSDEESDDYNVVPLKDCLDIVKNWCQDLEEVKEEYFKKMVEEKQKTKEAKVGGKEHWDMSSYYANRYAEATDGNFCFGSNVYNATTDEAEKVPADIEGYWAVMIDMHN